MQICRWVFVVSKFILKFKKVYWDTDLHWICVMWVKYWYDIFKWVSPVICHSNPVIERLNYIARFKLLFKYLLLVWHRTSQQLHVPLIFALDRKYLPSHISIGCLWKHAYHCFVIKWTPLWLGIQRLRWTTEWHKSTNASYKTGPGHEDVSSWCTGFNFIDTRYYTMHLCMYVCMYVCVRACVHVYMYVWLHRWSDGLIERWMLLCVYKQHYKIIMPPMLHPSPVESVACGPQWKYDYWRFSENIFYIV